MMDEWMEINKNTYRYPVNKTTNFWHRIVIRNGSSFIEYVSAFLFDLGCIGIEETEPDLSVYFPGFSDSAEITSKILNFMQKLSGELGIKQSFSVVGQKIKQENWQHNWMEFFKPIFLNSKLVIVPPWEKIKPKNGQQVVTIDPGQAFGTGHHATTYLLLQTLLRYQTGKTNILDVGSGSGILAIAAVKMGCKNVIAYDIDSIAVKTAVENARLNNVSGSIHFFTGELSALNRGVDKFDLILANITSAILYSIIPQLGIYLKKSAGLVVFSGILRQEKEKMCNVLAENGYQIKEVIVREEWVCMICSKLL